VGASPDTGSIQKLNEQMGVMVENDLLGVTNGLQLLDSFDVRHGHTSHGGVAIDVDTRVSVFHDATGISEPG
jgi:hypothetical protein